MTLDRMANKDLRIGLHYHHTSQLWSAIQEATQAGYNFIVTRLVHPRAGRFAPHCDLQLASNDWATLVVGELTEHNLDLPDQQLISSEAIDNEATYASHLGLHALLVKCPSTSAGISQLARLINSKLTSGYQSLPDLWLEVPIQAPEERAHNHRNDVDKQPVEVIDTWQRWNQFRSLLTPNKHVALAIDLSGELPDDESLKRWAGEPVKILIIPTTLFLTNKLGYPVLSRRHQIFVRMLINSTARNVHFVIRGNRREEDVRFYCQYIEHVKDTQMPDGMLAKFARGYEDFLQIPLQPLMDNLESHTYEIFEKDPIKYSEYGKAIQKAFLTLKKLKNDQPIVVLVVGAGRGPLVHATLESAEVSDCFVRVFAVEKNPNAIVTLKSMREHSWGGADGLQWGRVEVVSSDMRDWMPPDGMLADLVVSELLGSFSDNELSPECLDGVRRCAAEWAISIPTSYRSYLAPIQSQKLHTAATLLRERDKPSFASLETAFVVHLCNCYLIDQPLPVFEFDHSNFGHPLPKNHSNARFASLLWRASVDTVIHGFGGYFDTVLYDDVTLSTVPGQHTPGMFSWFPIYFPIARPIPVKAGQSIRANIWRLVNRRQIWYEWAVVEPTATAIHNPNGRSYAIGLL